MIALSDSQMKPNNNVEGCIMMRAGLTLVAVLGILGGLAFAHARDDRSERSHVRQDMMAELKLSDAQKEQIGKLRFEHQKSMIDARARTQKARLELRQLMHAEKPDRAVIDKSLRAVSDAQLQQKTLRVDHWFAVRSLLTPEQQEIWKNMPLMEPRGDFRKHRNRDAHRNRNDDDERE